jgi:predicted SAM-dependent methyltransferase
MLQALVGRMRRMMSGGPAGQPDASLPAAVSLRDMVSRLALIPHWEDKIAFARKFEYEADEGHWTRLPVATLPVPARDVQARGAVAAEKIHYGCGGNMIDGWLNVDWHESAASGYRRANLLETHPFESNSVRFGFSEDMLEHFSQAESIFFLSEVHRTLAPGGVMRLSFPGLEGILKRHYSPPSERRVREGELEAYAYWGHVHFYGRDELRMVAGHLGFTSVRFVEYGKSDHPELCNLDTRSDQVGLNTYAELTK